jgi:hypothetical protein
MEELGKIIGKGIENAATVVGFKDAKKGKVIIVGGIVIIVGVLIALGVNRFIKRKRAGSYDVLDMEKELDKISSGNTTLTDGQAILISQNLLSAMDRVGTDNKAIYDNLNQCQTKGDLLLVIQKFGIKPYDGWGLADTWLSKNVGSTMKNLNGWLRAEMSSRDLKPVIEIYDKFGVSL